MEVIFWDLALVLYVLSLFSWVVLKDRKKAILPFFAAVLVHLLGFLVRWYEGYRLGFGYPPLATMYESLSLFGLAVSVFYLLALYRSSAWRFLGFVSSMLSGLALLLPLLVGMSRSLRPLMPALQSLWLPIHVTTCLISYACFALAFFAGVFELFPRPKSNFVPPPWVLEELSYKTVAIGFVFLTAGIFTGAVWAHYAWGRYWSWDPKETWSLITWFIYAGWLHMRFVRGWRGKRMAVLSVIGFLAVLFTYFGVNYLLSGLHSYV